MKILFVFVGILAFCGFVFSADLTVTIHSVTAEGIGKAIGTITASDTKYGLLLKPALSGLPAGEHGFHVHENANCHPAQNQKEGKMAAAHAAGGHLNPSNGKHDGPYGEGHLGDLPALYVESDGRASTPVLAPRLKVADLTGHALMIHQGGDNYSDSPRELGGGGPRIACGAVK